MRQRFLLFIFTICLLGNLFVGIIAAQDSTTNTNQQEQTSEVGGPSSELDTTVGLPQAFSAYACTFDRNSNQARVQTIFMDANGRPVSRSDFRSIAVVQTDTDLTLRSRDVIITPLAPRPPMRMVIVLDITETVPLLEIKEALVDSLIPNLLPEDEVALITFGSEVGTPTPFFTDKNRLINEYVLDLEPEGGNNRIYNAILQSVDVLENFTSSQRRTILIVTDSGERVAEQASVDEIIRRSQAAGIQVYPIGFFSRDRPDVNVLRRLAYETNGYVWLYEEVENTRASIQSSVSSFLVDFTEALNSELRVDILAPEPSPNISGLAQYRLSVVQSGGQGLETTINCPIDELQHSITFAGDTFNHVTSDPVEVAVNVDTDLNAEVVLVRFFVNNEPVQTSASRRFTFLTSEYPPGPYEIRAQLLDRNDNVLATTADSLSIYAQQKLDVFVTSGSLEVLDRAIGLSIVAGSGIDIETVQVNLYTPGQEAPKPLASPSIVDGRTSTILQNLQADIEEFAPNTQTGDVVQVRIEVPGDSPGDPPLAQPYVLNVTYTAPEAQATVEARPLPVWIRALLYIRNSPAILLSLITFALLLFNILLFRLVRRLQIQKMIARPDDTELAETLMMVTVRSEEDEKQSYQLTKKTMFVGRGSETNQIDLGGNEQISRRHGVIMWRRGQWWYTNRKSNVVSYVEGRRVRGMKLIRLEPITEIKFPAGAEMIFHFDSQQNVDALFDTDLGQ